MSERIKKSGIPDRGLRYLQKNKRQTVAFMVCLGVSALLWVMIKLNKHYNHELVLPVIIASESANHRIRPLQGDTITLEVNALGYQLLFNRMKQPGNLLLKLKPQQLRTSTTPNIRFITAQNLQSHLIGQLHPSTQIIAIHPDTLFFRVDEVITRMLPVIPVMTIDFAPNYLLYDTVRVIPDSIKVRGERAAIEAIPGIYAKPINIKQVDKSFSYRLQLINPAPEALELETEQVTLSGQVSLFTDLRISVPVTLPDTLRDAFNIPPSVEINCRIPESQRNTFDTKELIATIGQIHSGESQASIEIIVKAPPFVKNITITPAYLTIKNPTE